MGRDRRTAAVVHSRAMAGRPVQGRAAARDRQFRHNYLPQDELGGCCWPRLTGLTSINWFVQALPRRDAPATFARRRTRSEFSYALLVWRPDDPAA